jgi:hypothetical protein
MISERTPGRRFDIYLGDDVQEFFVDGQARVFISTGVSKLELFRIIDSKDESGGPVDQREIFLRLIMPTAALLEFAAMTISTLSNNLAAMETGNRQALEAIKNAVRVVQKIEIPE